MDNNYDLLTARSIIMLIMVFVQNFHVLNCRSEKESVFKTPILSNPLIIMTIIGAILLQLVMISVPILARFLKINSLSFNTIMMSFVFSLIIIVVAEVYKLIYRKIVLKK